MAENALLSSPNWFLTSVAACSVDGCLAYGSRNGIILIRSIKEKEGCAAAPDFETVPNAHREKVTAIAFANRSIPDVGLPVNPLASASEDGGVMIWNIENLDVIKCHREHKDKVLCIDWSRKGDLLLVTGDDRGKIVVWDVAADNLRIISLLNSSRLAPHALACCPSNQDIVAVGCKDGLVCLLNIKGQGQLMSKLRGHDKTVVSLSWSPWTEGAAEEAYPLLASGGLDQEIHIWQPKTGLNVKTMQTPAKKLGSGFKVKPEKGKSSIVTWLPILWLKPTLLLSGSASSELLSWNPLADKPSPRLIQDEHLRGLSCITAPPCKTNLSDWREPEEAPVVWTVAQDRKITRSIILTSAAATDKNEKSEENEVQEQENKTLVFPTLGGFVYCMSPCPFAPGRVAIGVGDETIRIWTMSDSSSINVTIIWQRIKGKVMALAWHPEKEGVLAFGTSDGRVGICNVSNTNKEPVIFRQFHRSTVYRVTWGPPAYAKDTEQPVTEYCLYACDETTSVYYNPAEPQKAPVLLKSIIQASNPAIKLDTKHKELCWKSDFSLLAIGLDDGCVQLYSVPHLKCVHTLFAHKKCVYFLSFHPSCTATDDGLAPQRHWLASASTDQQINVFDLTPLVPEDEESNEWKPCSLPIEPFAELKHGGKVVCLVWNPHISGQLASSSYDKSVKIWDVAKQEIKACYFQHTGCVLSCCWSMLDPDIMLSGSADFTTQAWCISKALPDSQPLRRDKVRQLPEESVSRAVGVKTDVAHKETNKGITHTKNDKSSVELKKSQPQEIKKNIRFNLFPVSGPASNKKEKALLCCEQLMRNEGVLPDASVDLAEKKTEEPCLLTDKPSETKVHMNGEMKICDVVAAENVESGTEGESEEKQILCDGKKKENGIEANGTIVDKSLELTEEFKSLTIGDLPNIGYFTSQENMQVMLNADGHALKLSGNYKGFYNLELWCGNLHGALKSAVKTKHLNDWLVSLAPSVSHKVWLEMCAAYAEQLVQEEDYLKAASYFLVCHKVMEAVEMLKENCLYREAVCICQCRLGPDDPATKTTICQWGKFSASQGSFELAAQCFVAIKDYKSAATVLSKRKDPKMWKLGALLAKEAGETAVCMSLASECFFVSLIEEDWSAPINIVKEHPNLEPLLVLMEAHQIVCELSKSEQPGEDVLARLWNNNLESEDSLLEQLCKLCESCNQDDLYSKLLSLLPVKRLQQPDSRKELLLHVSKLLILAAAARREGLAEWERYIVEALHMGYRRGMVCVKERPLQSILCWLCCPILTKFADTEKSFMCAAMLDSLNRENPETPQLLTENKRYLLDDNSARYSRLTVLIAEREKESASQAAKKNNESAQELLTEARNAKEALEQEHVAFPNPLIMFCKLQSMIEFFKEKEAMDPEKLIEWEQDLNAFRVKLQK